ncbi:hypothetical protein SAMN02745115_01364 [[Eubacterium] yurii]|jgi:hypothetical protein|nr:hypothetical protein SAMN02745115_01364 [[Eubacterium] yurii]
MSSKNVKKQNINSGRARKTGDEPKKLNNRQARQRRNMYIAIAALSVMVISTIAGTVMSLF